MSSSPSAKFIQFLCTMKVQILFVICSFMRFIFCWLVPWLLKYPIQINASGNQMNVYSFVLSRLEWWYFFSVSAHLFVCKLLLTLILRSKNPKWYISNMAFCVHWLDGFFLFVVFDAGRKLALCSNILILECSSIIFSVWSGDANGKSGKKKGIRRLCLY